MDVHELIQKVFTKPIAQQQIPGVADPFLGVKPEVPQTKNDVFNPNILAEAQKTFTSSGHVNGSGSGPGQNSPPNPNAGQSYQPNRAVENR